MTARALRRAAVLVPCCCGAAATPTTAPSAAPAAPSAAPSLAPSPLPSASPTAAPSAPSAAPTAAPTAPSASPTAAPAGPSTAPTAAPSGLPSATPSAQPSSPPSRPPTAPTTAPSQPPSTGPTRAPAAPTAAPSTAAPSTAPSGSPTLPPVVPGRCGDGKVDLDNQEQCDDGNLANGDGCSAVCRVEGGWRCVGTAGNGTGQTSSCSPVCGDRILIGGEACDDGNAAAGDGCSPECKWEAAAWCDTVRFVPSLCYLLSAAISPAKPLAREPLNVTITGRGRHPLTGDPVTLQDRPAPWQVRLSSSSGCTTAAAGTVARELPADSPQVVFEPLSSQAETWVCVQTQPGAAFTALPGSAGFAVLPEPLRFAVEGERMAGAKLVVHLRSARLRGLASLTGLQVALSQRAACDSFTALGTSAAPVLAGLLATFHPEVDGEVRLCLSEDFGRTWALFDGTLVVYPRVDASLVVASAHVHRTLPIDLLVANQGGRAVNTTVNLVLSDILAEPAHVVSPQRWTGRGAELHGAAVCSGRGVARVTCTLALPALTAWGLRVEVELVHDVPPNTTLLNATAVVEVPDARAVRTLNASVPLVRPELRLVLQGQAGLPECPADREPACLSRADSCSWENADWRSSGRCAVAAISYTLLLTLANAAPGSRAERVDATFSVAAEPAAGETPPLAVYNATASRTGNLTCRVFASGRGSCALLQLDHGAPQTAALAFAFPATFGGTVIAAGQATGWRLLWERSQTVVSRTPLAELAAAAAPLPLPPAENITAGDSGDGGLLLGLPYWAWAVLAVCGLLCSAAAAWIACRLSKGDKDASESSAQRPSSSGASSRLRHGGAGSKARPGSVGQAQLQPDATGSQGGCHQAHGYRAEDYAYREEDYGHRAEDYGYRHEGHGYAGGNWLQPEEQYAHGCGAEQSIRPEHHGFCPDAGDLGPEEHGRAGGTPSPTGPGPPAEQQPPPPPLLGPPPPA
eukprot:TRINITY_DN10426_c0_g1_i2.p1 TRINITY_DN10426_c0_g1~~TRINITY_DN10426_c0_g1_i2.p1  ORF type:complete len:1002 (+),score=286.59 TRINITY_DN10426_c0_g1_i2:80-3007(+)